MKNDSTSFFENNHFANSYVYDISISHVPAYFGLHWHQLCLHRITALSMK
jgi:hypothetical protein